MNRDVGTVDDARPIDLATEAPFALGGIRVAPAALTLDGPGWSQRLEPRAMQVLVVLARASPEVVSRRELNSRVWGGRVVGDDAVNRAVQTLRRVAAEAPSPPPFTITTIPRIGYRLQAGEGAVAVRDAVAPSARMVLPRSSSWRWAGLVAAMFVAIAGWRALASHDAAPGVWTIASTEALDGLPTDAADVVLSPDGTRLAYRGRDADGRDRIFVRAIDAADAGRPVSPLGLDARRPAWSPDGVDLAFAAYDPDRPCRLYIVRPGTGARPVGACETVRDPRLSWSADGRSLLFGDAPGENGVQRIGALAVGDGRRTVLSSPPADSMGDGLPIARASDVVFQRQFSWADEGWIGRDLSTGRERLLWRRRGVIGSVAAPLPDGSLAVAWTRAGISALDVIAADGAILSHPISFGPIAALSASGARLVAAADRNKAALVRAGAAPSQLVTVRGAVYAPVPLAGGGFLLPVATGGSARIRERTASGSLRAWGMLTAARIAGLAISPDGSRIAALVTGDDGREIVVLDARGEPVYRWTPHRRSLNAAAWSADGRHLIVPVLDGDGWRLWRIDPFARAAPRDMDLPGYAVVQARGAALYGIRAGEATGVRELWRLDGTPRRLPFDLTLFDIVNWRAVDRGIWLPDRSDRGRPRLVLRDAETGRVLRSVAAAGLAGPGFGLAAIGSDPIYAQSVSNDLEYGVLNLRKGRAVGQ